MNYSENDNFLFETKKGNSIQCDETNSIIINFNGSSTSYKLQEFIIFQRMVNSVNVLDMIYDLSDDSDFKLIEASKRNFSKNMTICEMVQLRELLNGTKFTLTLHSMLNEVLNDILV